MDSIDYYERYGNAYFEETVNLSMEHILEKFARYLPENAEVLDLGCGSGRDTLWLEEAGFSVTMLDGSAQMCQLAEIHTDHEVLHMTFQEMDFQEVFDGIWACASLLHVPEEEMDSVMQKVSDALKPGGFLYLSFQYGGDQEIRGRRFYHDYTETSAQELIRRQRDLRALKLWVTEDDRKERHPKKWLNIIAKKHGSLEDADE
ncbi:MAG: methyltransferase domain-containing protein [Eubacteriales bacterium]|nr:methyltransferase domain-containing protein [Eubacteriales bacterium]